MFARCPSLDELPPAPPGKTGWPWTEESPALPDRMPGGKPWPPISIVTPSYNQDRFLEETIRSVLLQGYPNLEYMVIDGDSTDKSVDIIRKYADWLAYWISKADSGQCEAINRGFTRAQGDILAWINSDDFYEAGALGTVAQSLDPVVGPFVVFGDCLAVDGQGNPLFVYRGIEHPFLRKLCYWLSWDVPQPSVFFAHDVLEKVGILDESLHFALDYDLFLRMSCHYEFVHTGKVLARYTKHSSAKGGTSWRKTRAKFHREKKSISQRYWPGLSKRDYRHLRTSYAWHRLKTVTGLTALRYELTILRRRFSSPIQPG